LEPASFLPRVVFLRHSIVLASNPFSNLFLLSPSVHSHSISRILSHLFLTLPCTPILPYYAPLSTPSPLTLHPSLPSPLSTPHPHSPLPTPRSPSLHAPLPPGPNREIKKAVESYWAGKSSVEDLQKVAKEVRKGRWESIKAKGVDYVPS
jgi:hypothetical protein